VEASAAATKGSTLRGRGGGRTAGSAVMAHFPSRAAACPRSTFLICSKRKEKKTVFAFSSNQLRVLCKRLFGTQFLPPSRNSQNTLHQRFVARAKVQSRQPLLDSKQPSFRFLFAVRPKHKVCNVTTSNAKRTWRNCSNRTCKERIKTTKKKGHQTKCRRT
jgi:hypothetical protein